MCKAGGKQGKYFCLHSSPLYHDCNREKRVLGQNPCCKLFKRIILNSFGNEIRGKYYTEILSGNAVQRKSPRPSVKNLEIKIEFLPGQTLIKIIRGKKEKIKVEALLR